MVRRAWVTVTIVIDGRTNMQLVQKGERMINRPIRSVDTLWSQFKQVEIGRDLPTSWRFQA